MPDWTLSNLLQQGGLSVSLRALSAFGDGYSTGEVLAKEYKGIQPEQSDALIAFATAAATAASMIETLAPGTGIQLTDVPQSPIQEPNTIQLNVVAEVKDRSSGQTMRRPINAIFDIDAQPSDMDKFIKGLIREYFKQKYPNATIGRPGSVSYTIYSATRG